MSERERVRAAAPLSLQEQLRSAGNPQGDVTGWPFCLLFGHAKSKKDLPACKKGAFANALTFKQANNYRFPDAGLLLFPRPLFPQLLPLPLLLAAPPAGFLRLEFARRA